MNKDKLATERAHMVEHQIAARGVHSIDVLRAMGKVPREAFLPEALEEFAYQDTPLPIAEDQTISQPYIVAFMIEAAGVKPGMRVLEIGTGSGYAAAVLAEIASDVYTIERINNLVVHAQRALERTGYNTVHIRHGDGTQGWAEHAPYDAIIVAAGGPDVPDSLKQQLKIGGRLIIPVGAGQTTQELVRVTRISEARFTSEDIADVRFVPLVGREGWSDSDAIARGKREQVADVASVVRNAAESFDDIATADLTPLLERIGDARIVLLGEASHGTSEFYRMRARITQALIEEKGFDFVGIEGDWPDAARVDHYVRHMQYPPSEWTAFARFPTWMWRNEEVRSFVDWLRLHNSNLGNDERVAFRGLDLYSLFNSIRAVLEYLDEVDPATAAIARTRYGCLTPWQSNPASYGEAALNGQFNDCEQDVVSMLMDILENRQVYAEHDGERFLSAEQNARLVTNAERYYRVMFYGSRASWNLRDSYMFNTLRTLLDFHGNQSKAVVWAHNSHIGDSNYTEMAARGEHNIGHLCRRTFGEQVYSIGFGTHCGEVAAADNWDDPMQVKTIEPSLGGSYERICHDTGIPQFFLPLRKHGHKDVKTALSEHRIERAIGVIYRPESERQSHYFQAVLPDQFDEYVWFDRTTAVTPLATTLAEGLPDTYPFGL